MHGDIAAPNDTGLWAVRTKEYCIALYSAGAFFVRFAAGGPRFTPSCERCESQSPVSNGQTRVGAPTGAGDEVNGPLRTEANCLDCGHLSRFAARRLCFFVRLRGRGCSIVNTPYNPRTLLGAFAAAGRMSIPGHAALASRRRPWRRSD